MLVAVSAARVVLVASTGFNGLIGQDAYAYFGYVVDSLVVDGALVFPPPPFPFPPGYPYLVAVAVLVLGAAPWVGQLLSFAAALVAAILTAGLAHRVWPGRPWLAATAGSLVVLNGHLGRASILVMSDACGLAAATASVLLVMEYRRSGRAPWLVTAAAAAAAAVLCRWAMGLVAVPVTLYALAALVRLPRGRALVHALAAAMVTLIVLSPVLVELGSETPGFVVDFDAARWSPAHALQRTTVSAEGTQTIRRAARGLLRRRAGPPSRSWRRSWRFFSCPVSGPPSGRCDHGPVRGGRWRWWSGGRRWSSSFSEGSRCATRDSP